MNLDNPTVVPAPDANPSAMAGDAFPPTMGGDTQPTHQTTGELPPQQTPQKIVVGDKVFNTTEEAIAYAEGFVQSQTKAMQRMTPVLDEPAPVQTKRPGTLIFEDPDQALADVENRAVERMRAEQKTIDDNKNFWEDFKRTYPDLVGTELVVDAVLAREQAMGTLKNMTREQAAPILAAKARQEVAKIKNVPSGGQALPSNPAMVAGASGASTPRPQAPQPVATNFVGELRGMRKRG